MKRGTLVVVALVVVGMYVGPFAVDATDSPDPVRFGETMQTGLTTDTVRSAQARGHVVPKVQTFYAQYQYVVGYYGVESYVATATSEGRDRRFGPSVAVYVTEFSGTNPRLTDGGFLDLADGARPSWVRAADATYAVVEPAGIDRATPTVVPFADPSDARAFVATFGGSVRTWSDLLASLDAPERSVNRAVRWPAERDREANATVARVAPMVDRPVSVVVGEDAPTIQAAVREAPPNTTVYVPEGRYQERVTIAKPLTLAGAGADTVVDGAGEGTVIVVESPGVAVASMRLTGVGNETVSVTENASGWDSIVEQTYGRGDAGVAFLNTTRALVSNVSVETPSNGLLFRDTDRAVVTNVSVRGHPDEATGYMGVVAMRSSVVVQDSTFVDGLDAVYAHRSNGIVVRDNELRDARFGVHLMFTSGALLAHNTVHGMDTGLVVMTRPARNAIVGNDVRESTQGVVTAGGDSYIADNVLVDNAVGLKIGSRSSLYEGNVIAHNEVGVKAANYVASNRVVGNDFLANGEHVQVVAGPQRVWSTNGRGNYWDTADAGRGGVVAAGRPYSPTDPVTAALHRPGHLTLARSPAYQALEALRGAIPGMRESGVVDESPAPSPVTANATGATDVTATGATDATATDGSEPSRRETLPPTGE